LKINIFGIKGNFVHDVIETCYRNKIRFRLIDNIEDPNNKKKLSISTKYSWQLNQISTILGLATPEAKKIGLNSAQDYGFTKFCNLVDKNSTISRSVVFGKGNYITAGVVISPKVTVNNFVTINKGALIGHHVMIDDFCFIGPGAIISGGVKIGKGSYIGAGAIIRDGITIGEDSVIGAGAVVVKDVAKNLTVVGNPAKTLVK